MPYTQDKITKQCVICGKEFEIVSYSSHQKYCSKHCREEAHRLNKGIDVQCAKCGKVFKIPPSQANVGRKYCSSECAGNGYSRVNIECLNCHVVFPVIACRKETAMYCSDKCFIEYRSKHPEATPGWRGGKSVLSICQNCGTEIRERTPRRYCSPECVHAAQQKRLFIRCSLCGKEFEITPCQEATRRYCSIECFRKAMPNSQASKECFSSVLHFLGSPSCSREKTFPWLSSPKGHPLWLDLYIPSLKLAIEYNGIQHYQYSPLFHHEDRHNLECQQERDALKAKQCNDHNIQLVTFRYDEKIAPALLRERLGVYKGLQKSN